MKAMQYSYQQIHQKEIQDALAKNKKLRRNVIFLLIFSSVVTASNINGYIVNGSSLLWAILAVIPMVTFGIGIHTLMINLKTKAMLLENLK